MEIANFLVSLFNLVNLKITFKNILIFNLFKIVAKNTQEYLFRASEIFLIKVETNFNFEGILTV